MWDLICDGCILMQTDDTITKIIQLAYALETSRFSDFWVHANNSKDIIASSKYRFMCSMDMHAHGRAYLHDCSSQVYLLSTNHMMIEPHGIMAPGRIIISGPYQHANIQVL